jgi:hypothetical protein
MLWKYTNTHTQSHSLTHTRTHTISLMWNHTHFGMNPNPTPPLSTGRWDMSEWNWCCGWSRAGRGRCLSMQVTRGSIGAQPQCVSAVRLAAPAPYPSPAHLSFAFRKELQGWNTTEAFEKRTLKYERSQQTCLKYGFWNENEGWVILA